jgi:sodium-dependent dicarboxylate transporter 2/3/5
MGERAWRRLALLAGPLGLGVWMLLGDGAPSATMGGIAWWVALWWVSDVLPIGATSLLPLVLMPVLGIANSGVVAGCYMDRFIMLMMAGFMAALAIERHGLHRRLALWSLLGIGTSPRRLILGMLLVTAFASAWIANTAATLIMLPIGLAVVGRLRQSGRFTDEAQGAMFATAISLAIAYGASIGGIATPIGTPPNLIYLGAVQQHFGEAPSFLDWMLAVGPIVLGMLALAWWWFVRRLGPVPPEAMGEAGARTVLRDELAALGGWSGAEKRVAGVFAAMVVLWVTRDVDLGGGQHIGWAPWLGLEKFVDDATVAVAGTLALFVWPVPKAERATGGERLLTWETARRIPWEVVLLFGGGLALAKGFDVSGLSAAIGDGLGGVETWSALAVIAGLALVVTFLTEITSNTAITTLLMPILAPIAVQTGFGPEVVMLPAAISASCAFMLPVATPPNAVVFGTGHVPIGAMVRAGFVLNLGGVVLIVVVLGLRHAL